MKKLKENKAITLIALVITIIILLILAGITISQLSNNGLFGKSQEAKEISENAVAKEEAELAKYENEINSYVNGNRDTVTIPKEEYEELKRKVDSLSTFSTTEKIVGKLEDGSDLWQVTYIGKTPATNKRNNMYNYKHR